MNLPAQGMKIIRRRGDICDLHIIFAAKLEVPFQPRGGMLGPLPFIAMGQQHHQAGHAQPLGFTRCDKLINNELSAVGKIAELRFPKHQGLWIGQRQTVFEPENRRFRQRAVSADKSFLSVPDVFQWGITLLGFLIDEDRVTLGKCPAGHILAAQPHQKTFRQKRSKGEGFRSRPINSLASFQCGSALVKHASELWMQLETFWEGGKRISHLIEPFQR